MNKHSIEALTYWDVLDLAQKTAWNLNHAGWVIYQDDNVKYTLDTLNEGREFRIGQWEPGHNVGSIIRTILPPSEILFLFSLRE